MAIQRNGDRKWVNGMFVKKVWQSDDKETALFGIGIKKQEFLAEITALQADDRGFINLTMGAQKDDIKKYSVWLDDKSQRPAKTSSAPAQKSTSTEDELPF